MEHCQEVDERHHTEQYKRAEGRYQIKMGFNNTSAVPQADRLHATVH